MEGRDIRRLTTGIGALDEILEGGLVPRQAYLVRGGPGTGKITLGLHFLTAGSRAGEATMFITPGEPEDQIRLHAESRGFDLSGITFLDLSPSPEFFTEVEAYDIFSPSEVERAPITERIVEQVKAVQPVRVFIDSMTQFRYLADDAFQFRKQTLSFLRFLVAEGATVLLTSEDSDEIPDDDLQFLCDGIIHLTFSGRNRTLSVTKFRGSSFQSGQHAMRLGQNGVGIFPILLPPKRRCRRRSWIWVDSAPVFERGAGVCASPALPSWSCPPNRALPFKKPASNTAGGAPSSSRWWPGISCISFVPC
ncbi:ATPase domain-containing protein [Aggregatilinea lenta]|uniref:ATPase domain-containing protein n=1 Tax=Aggregatilinea lenta TaxID=913108 RepID=UPI000E5BC316|nr:ATPase domain-containing protein [Aggregatilinea lenta]